MLVNRLVHQWRWIHKLQKLVSRLTEIEIELKFSIMKNAIPAVIENRIDASETTYGMPKTPRTSSGSKKPDKVAFSFS